MSPKGMFVPALAIAAITSDYFKPKQVGPIFPSQNKIVLMSGIDCRRRGNGSTLLKRDHLLVCKVEVVVMNARWMLE